MDRHARLTALLRYLRIAFSIGCGILCLLLIALWVRSYRYVDIVFPATDYRIAFKSQQGQIYIGVGNDSWIPPFSYGRMGIDSSEVSLNGPSWTIVNKFPGDIRLVIPHWFLVSLSGFVAVMPWIVRRFSLRTLLIAAAVVAVGLGLFVIMLRGS
jgi:hypothetical protein